MKKGRTDLFDGAVVNTTVRASGNFFASFNDSFVQRRFHQSIRPRVAHPLQKCCAFRVSEHDAAAALADALQDCEHVLEETDMKDWQF